MNEDTIYKKPRKTWLTCLYGVIFIVLCFILVMVIVFNVKYISAPVEGSSMQPTLNGVSLDKEDTVYINKFAKYGLGDIIVIKSPTEKDKYIIKRVIGLEGDTISIYNDGEKYVLERTDSTDCKAHIVQEDYIKSVEGMEKTYQNLFNERTGLINSEKWKSCFSYDSENDRHYFTVPAGTVFVLGDNRQDSLDSSISGPFSVDSVVGKVEHIVKYGESKLAYFIKDFFGAK